MEQAKVLKYSTKFITKNTETKRVAAKPKSQLQDASWIEEKYTKVPFFTAFKLAKDTGFELEQPRQKNAFLPKLPQQ
ncbi:hypothetical protein RUX70_004231 [Vibrio vulnificus]|nr:hypothetical protein [Vibrio vulnificus]ELK2284019.1 hypothetical protein [Vibrio vulnificus]